MRIAAQNINKQGYTVTQSDFNNTYIKYIKQYNKYCSMLFDLGFSTSPSVFDEVEFWSIFFEEYPNLQKLFVHKRTGEFVYTKLHINYILRLIDGQESTILQCVKYILEAEQAIKDLSTLYTSTKMKKKTKKVKFNPSITVSRTIYNNNKYPVDSPYVQECLNIPEGCITSYVDYDIVILEVLLEQLGISRDGSVKSMFLGDGFSLSDDCIFLELLLTGEIIGQGKYGKLLYDTIEAYYHDYYESQTTKATVIGYYDDLYIKATPRCIEYINACRKELYAKNFTEFIVTPRTVIFVSKDNDYESINIENLNHYIGGTILDYCDGYKLHNYNRLLGLSGEFVSEMDIEKNNYVVDGAPIILYDLSENNGKFELVEMYYYPILCVKQRVNDKLINIQPNLSVHDFFKPRNIKEVCKELGVSCLEEVSAEVTRVLGGETNDLAVVIGYLVQAMFCVECDYKIDNYVSPNHVKLPSDNNYVMDKKLFNLACMEACSVFRKLGF